MEPITTELREFVANKIPVFYEVLHDEFNRLCDNIDAIHAQLERDYATACEVNEQQDAEYAALLSERNVAYNKGFDDGFASADDWLAQHEDAMAEHGWVRLPVDADGVPINAGDDLDGYGKTIEVVEMRHGRSGWVLISRDGNGYADTFAFTHYHAPTVEDVLREFADEFNRDDTELCDEEIIERFAARLRLAGDA